MHETWILFEKFHSEVLLKYQNNTGNMDVIECITVGNMW